MKNIFKIVVLALSCITFGVAQNKKQDGIFAEFNTTKGKIVVELEFKKTPVTVANFISLAEGKNTKADAKFKGKPYYNGLKFHRVIADFMIQGGCPDGTGASGPGYKFDDEIVADLKHSGKGILSMANAGPATNSRHRAWACTGCRPDRAAPSSVRCFAWPWHRPPCGTGR